MVNLDLWLNARWTCLGFNPSQFMKSSRRKTQPQQKLSKNTSVQKKALQILEERQKLLNITQSHDAEFATFLAASVDKDGKPWRCVSPVEAKSVARVRGQQCVPSSLSSRWPLSRTHVA